MTAEEVKAQIKEIISNVSNIPSEEIGDEDHYVDDLDLDSLSLLEIGVDVDYTFQLGLAEDEMSTIVNVSQGAALVLERLAEKEAAKAATSTSEAVELSANVATAVA